MSKRYRRYLYLTAFVLAVYVFAVLYAAHLQGTALLWSAFAAAGRCFYLVSAGQDALCRHGGKATPLSQSLQRERDFQDLAKMSLLFPVDTSSETLISPLTKEDSTS